MQVERVAPQFAAAARGNAYTRPRSHQPTVTYCIRPVQVVNQRQHVEMRAVEKQRSLAVMEAEKSVEVAMIQSEAALLDAQRQVKLSNVTLNTDMARLKVRACVRACAYVRACCVCVRLCVYVCVTTPLLGGTESHHSLSKHQQTRVRMHEGRCALAHADAPTRPRPRPTTAAASALPAILT